jgi:C-terminal processing protease CtpA/Prc
MKILTLKTIAFSFLCLSVLSCMPQSSYGQGGMDRIERSRMKDILRVVKNNVKKSYYDPEFKGIDIEARFKLADDKLNAATSVGQAMGIIAQALIDFNDSHLYFIPPSTNLAVEYGWKMQAVGDKILVTSVKPGSDAAAKGLKPGDQIISVSGFKVSRPELWKVIYYYNGISKRDRLNLSILGPGEKEPRELSINAELKTLPRAINYQNFFRIFDDFYEEENDKHRFRTIGGIQIWRMPGFDFEPTQVDSLMDRMRSSSGLILDLRGNGGGYVKTLERLSGSFFDKDLKIADLKGRKSMDPMVSRTRGNAVFKGRLIVLVDSRSGSASEIFARLVQLENRGKVLGDVSAGSVMQSQIFSESLGVNSLVMFAVSITNADVIMSDNKSIEHVGVIPDELILPTGEDLADGRDPVLARAVELLGGQLSADAAGKFFPYFWKKG